MKNRWIVDWEIVYMEYKKEDKIFKGMIVIDFWKIWKIWNYILVDSEVITMRIRIYLT